MARREYTSAWPCGEPGCRERAYYIYDTRREQDKAAARYHKEPWRCTRHSRPEQVLTPASRIRRVEATASRVPYKSDPEQYLDGLYWIGDGFVRSGLETGPGFLAFASDFPEGTRLIVTAEVVMPDA